MICQVSGCGLVARWQVGHGSTRRHVCRKCRDELIAFGWELKRSLYDPAVA